MTYSELIQVFLSKVKIIADSKPAYKQPGDGSDGTCDCIGLIIGAIRRMGLKWPGIHGSNYAARKAIVGLSKINSVNELEVGDVVLKACDSSSSTWNLPARYKRGGAYYNGDLKDYYHAGVVTSVNPLNITHMTSPTIKVDKSLGKWNYHGKAKPIVDAAKDSPTPEPVKPNVPNTGSRAIIVSDNGGPVKMRQYPSKSCRTWDKLSVGTEVIIDAPGEEWAKITYGKRNGWYMMAQYLDVVGDNKGKY